MKIIMSILLCSLCMYSSTAYAARIMDKLKNGNIVKHLVMCDSGKLVIILKDLDLSMIRREPSSFPWSTSSTDRKKILSFKTFTKAADSACGKVN